MKILVIGGSGLIGTKLVKKLRQRGQEVVAASPKTGVDTRTGKGLGAAMDGAEVVVDVANSPSFEAAAALEFFETAARNIFAVEARAGVGHHIALSVVGADRLLESGYMRAKLAQESAIKNSKMPYTILRATQFFEFIGSIVEAGADGATIRLTPALMQPIAAEDVAAELADIALAPPLNGTVEVAGPDSSGIDALARQFLRAKGDSRKVVTDARARYFDAEVDDRSLRPAAAAHLGRMHFEEWLAQNIGRPTTTGSV
jgi:uncharacterized protein YbjT (DUF2867 family)